MVSAADALMKAQILVDDSAGLSALEVRSRARRVARTHAKLSLIVVDYLQMLNYPEYSRQGRQIETAAISGALKAMSKELRVPVLVLSQLSRNPENRDKEQTPRLSDLRDSGSIEQDADVVLLLQRPSRVKGHKDHEDQRLAYVDVAKHRNGATGLVKMNFEDYCIRFEDRDTRGGTDEDSAAPSTGDEE
jgi:replicative DNA helicase